MSTHNIYIIIGLQRIHSPQDRIRIAILASRYNTYRYTLLRLEIISNCMVNKGAHHTSKLFEMVHSHWLDIICVKFHNEKSLFLHVLSSVKRT